MTLRVAIVAPGEMGSAIARELRQGGASVSTSVAGRSAASRARAEREGFVLAPDDDALLAGCDLLLSVVPPDAAIALAERFAPALARAAHKPVYVDCNAIAPATALRIGEILAPTGCDYVDACLFGGPTSGKPGVVFYAAGAAAPTAARIAQHGPKVRVLQSGIGAASALKLAFAGLNKGFTALGAAMVLAAQRAGAAEGLAEQLADSQPAILGYVGRFVPAMFPKAGRWAPEMREVAEFLHDDPAASAIFAAMAPLYEQLSAQIAADDPAIAALGAFCQSVAPRKPAP